MEKIQKYTQLLLVISCIFGAIAFISICATWFFDSLPVNISNLILETGSNELAADAVNMPFNHRLMGLLVDFVAILIIYAGIMAFYDLMKKFQSGELFSENIITLLNKISRLVLFWTIYNPVRGMLLSIITTFHKGPGNRIIKIEFGTPDIINVFIFISLMIITLLIQESNKLKNEQDLTI